MSIASGNAAGGPSVSGLASMSRCSAARLGSSSGMSHGGMRTPPLSTCLSLLSSSDSRRAVAGTMPSRASPLAGMRINSTSFMPRSSGASCVNSPPPTNSSQRASDWRLPSACSRAAPLSMALSGRWKRLCCRVVERRSKFNRSQADNGLSSPFFKGKRKNCMKAIRSGSTSNQYVVDASQARPHDSARSPASPDRH